MNLQETLSLIESLRANGVIKFKSLEHDIVFDDLAKQTHKIVKPEPITQPLIPAEAAIQRESVDKLKNLIDTLNMSPEQLAKHMFPDES